MRAIITIAAFIISISYFIIRVEKFCDGVQQIVDDAKHLRYFEHVGEYVQRVRRTATFKIQLSVVMLCNTVVCFELQV